MLDYTSPASSLLGVMRSSRHQRPSDAPGAQGWLPPTPLKAKGVSSPAANLDEPTSFAACRWLPLLLLQASLFLRDRLARRWLRAGWQVVMRSPLTTSSSRPRPRHFLHHPLHSAVFDATCATVAVPALPRHALCDALLASPVFSPHVHSLVMLSIAAEVQGGPK